MPGGLIEPRQQSREFQLEGTTLFKIEWPVEGVVQFDLLNREHIGISDLKIGSGVKSRSWCCTIIDCLVASDRSGLCFAGRHGARAVNRGSGRIVGIQ